MDRRLFLKGLALSAAGATIPLKSERELHRHIYDDPLIQEEGFGLHRALPHKMVETPEVHGFNLAPVKAEGQQVEYDTRRYLTGPNEWYIMRRHSTYGPCPSAVTA